MGNFENRQVNNTFLRVVHHGHPLRNTLADNRAGQSDTVAVEYFNPVVISNAKSLASASLKTDHRTTAT
ncbi:hypothetical protein ACLK19_08355 [Escherichia coli]